MRTVTVFFSSEKEVKDFTDALIPLKGDFDLISGNYILDARSLMGIFSLDLSKPIQLKIHEDSEEVISALQKFIR